MKSLQEAAQAVVDRWDTPAWKDVEPTAVFIGELREAIAREEAQSPALIGVNPLWAATHPDKLGPSSKPTVQALMDLARKFRSCDGQGYDYAYKQLQNACYAALNHDPVKQPLSAEREELIGCLRKYSDAWEAIEEVGIQAQIDFARATSTTAADDELASEQQKHITCIEIDMQELRIGVEGLKAAAKLALEALQEACRRSDRLIDRDYEAAIEALKKAGIK